MNDSTAAPAAGQSTKVHLDLRSQRFSLERDALMELPESVLLCLFPNGVVLSSQRTGEEEDDEEEVFFVDFDGPCLSYILAFFLKARLDYYGSTTRRDEPPSLQSPLFTKQAIIVLREELEYFAIPPKSHPSAPSTDADGIPTEELLTMKRRTGTSLLERKTIFTALQRNVHRENNVAEQHLIDMLCMSGFNREDEWGYRSLEPNRCCITSIALVLLKTGITHTTPPTGIEHASSSGSTPSPTTSAAKTPPQVNANQLATAQKLLLFWRKPARKCWWDASEATIKLHDDSEVTIKVWSRRVWTLELSLI